MIKIYLHITEHIWFNILYGSEDDDLLMLGERRVKSKRRSRCSYIIVELIEEKQNGANQSSV